jgi:hypothetical protein
MSRTRSAPCRLDVQLAMTPADTPASFPATGTAAAAAAGDGEAVEFAPRSRVRVTARVTYADDGAPAADATVGLVVTDARSSAARATLVPRRRLPPRLPAMALLESGKYTLAVREPWCFVCRPD